MDEKVCLTCPVNCPSSVDYNSVVCRVNRRSVPKNKQAIDEEAAMELQNYRLANKEGRLCVFPFTLQQSLWYVVDSDIRECRITGITLGTDGRYTVYTLDKGNKKECGWFFESSFGRTIFTDKSKAEEAAALKRG